MTGPQFWKCILFLKRETHMPDVIEAMQGQTTSVLLDFRVRVQRLRRSRSFRKATEKNQGSMCVQFKL